MTGSKLTRRRSMVMRMRAGSLMVCGMLATAGTVGVPRDGRRHPFSALGLPDFHSGRWRKFAQAPVASDTHFLVKLVAAAPCSFCAAAWSLQHFLAKLVSAAPCKFLPSACILQLSCAAAALTSKQKATATIETVFMSLSVRPNSRWNYPDRIAGLNGLWLQHLSSVQLQAPRARRSLKFCEIQVNSLANRPGSQPESDQAA
jgi:hypothetical protein